MWNDSITYKWLFIIIVQAYFAHKLTKKGPSHNVTTKNNNNMKVALYLNFNFHQIDIFYWAPRTFFCGPFSLALHRGVSAYLGIKIFDRISLKGNILAKIQAFNCLKWTCSVCLYIFTLLWDVRAQVLSLVLRALIMN